MNRPRWPDSTNPVCKDPGTIQGITNTVCGRRRVVAHTRHRSRQAVASARPVDARRAPVSLCRSLVTGMSVLPEKTLTRILASIQANNLTLLCGAGLSIPDPTNLTSAVGVSRACYDKYAPIQNLPAELRDDLDALAGHFWDAGQFESVFIRNLVPWDDLTGSPNPGHEAVSDFLITRAVHGVLSANFDTMIENSASARKVFMRGALDGQEAVTFAQSMGLGPLLKFHGCAVRGQPQTLWTRRQLAEQAIQQRIESCTEWMNVNLPGRDLLIVGFWTDWRYLNEILQTALGGPAVGSVTVIDLLDEGELEGKAPTLWAILRDRSAQFEHVQASSSEALEEVRAEFSRVWMRRFFQLGRPLVEAATQTPVAPEILEPSSALGVEDLYNLRRDAEGVPYDRAARKKEPSPDAAQAASVHLRLLNANATYKGPWYEHDGQVVRVVQGAGQGLSVLREQYAEGPAVEQPDVVICAGAVDLGVPGRLVESGRGHSVVRPAPGGEARWLTLEQAHQELHL